MSVFKVILIAGAVTVGGFGCAEKADIPIQRRLQNAPRSNNETGILIMDADQTAVVSFLERHPTAMVRVINQKHGLYEMQFVDKLELQRTFPTAKIQDNIYIRIGGTAQVDERMSSTLAAANVLALRNQCQTRNDKSPMTIDVNFKMDRYEISYLADVDAPVAMSLRNPDPTLEYEWMLQAPAGAKNQQAFGKGSVFSFTPGIGGEHSIVLLGKDRKGNCVLTNKSIFATANPAIDRRVDPSKLGNFGLENFWHVASLGLKNFWAKQGNGQATVAIIDTGVNYNHAALQTSIFKSRDIPGNNLDDDHNGFVDDAYGYDFASSDPFPFDDDGHGTHVAGLAASPIFGVANHAKILPIKVMTGLGVDMGTFVGAVFYAVDEGADVINASFGWDVDHPFFRMAVQYANSRNVMIAAAAGNGDRFSRGMNNDTNPSYPCSYDLPNVISVAAIDEDGALTKYSNYGVNSVHVATFGGRAQMPLRSAAKKLDTGRDVQVMYGTSQATPLVAGAIALLKSANPNLSAQQMKQRLIGAAKPSSEIAGKIQASGPLDLGILLGVQTARP